MRKEQWKLRRCDSFELDHLMSVSQFPGVSLFTVTSRICQPVWRLCSCFWDAWGPHTYCNIKLMKDWTQAAEISPNVEFKRVFLLLAAILRVPVSVCDYERVSVCHSSLCEHGRRQRAYMKARCNEFNAVCSLRTVVRLPCTAACSLLPRLLFA